MIFGSDLSKGEFFAVNKSHIQKAELSDRMTKRLNRIASMTYAQYLALQMLSRSPVPADGAPH